MTLHNWNLKYTPCGLVCRKVARKILLGKRVEVERAARICAILLVIVPELQQGEADIFSLVSLRTWDLEWSGVIINKTELTA